MRIPIRQILEVLAAIILIVVLVVYCIAPLAQGISSKTLTLYTIFRDIPSQQVDTLKTQNKEMKNRHARLAAMFDAGKKIESPYNYFRETAINDSILVKRIEGKNSGAVHSDEYLLIGYGSYNRIGAAINALENGPVPCRVHSLHLVAKTLTDAKTDIELRVSFSKAAQ